MIERFQQWLIQKWQSPPEPTKELITAYGMIPDLVVQDLMDNVYCVICGGTDPIKLAQHDGQRSVVHMILQRIDLARNSLKYTR